MSLIDELFRAWQEHPIIVSIILVVALIALIIIFAMVNYGTESYMNWVGNLTQ